MKSLIQFLSLSVLLICNYSLAQTWTQIASGTSKNLTAISFPSSNVGYIGGEDSLILKTTDGGQTWTPLTHTGITFYPNGDDIVDIKFVSDLVGFVTIGPYSGSYKTIDGGQTWTAFDGIYACFNSALYFFDENNGFLGGSGCFSGEIINKLDGTWMETNVTPTFIIQGGLITNFDFWDSNLGMASSAGNYIFKTTDGGNVWYTIPNGLTENDSMTSVLFLNQDTLFATYKSTDLGTFGVNISFDGGQTWQPEINSATFFYPNMFATEKTGNGRIYIGGEQSLTSGGINPGLIYQSDGSITNWSYQSVDESIRDMDSYSDSVVFAVGKNGYIVVNQDLSQLGTNTIGKEFNFKIYPNPNQGEFTLELDDTNFEEMEVLDLLGNRVYSSRILPSDKIVRISGLSSGVYILRVKNKNQSAIKQLVIY